MNNRLMQVLVAAATVTASIAAFALTGANPAVVTASPANIRGARVINANPRPDLTDGPVARGHLFVTHNWNPATPTGTYFPHPVGFTNTDAFSLVSLDNAPQIAGVSYNTLFLTDGAPGTLYWRAAVGNIVNNYTTIDSLLCNGRPDARLTVTANLTSRDKFTGVANPHNIGVWYTGSKWAVFNQDMAAMPVNAAFSVFVDTTYGATVVATAKNTVGNSVYLDSIPALAGRNRGVRIVVTPNWSPVGGPNVYNNHPVGVWFDPARGWAIYNEDRAAMPAGAAFNVEWDTNQSTPG